MPGKPVKTMPGKLGTDKSEFVARSPARETQSITKKKTLSNLVKYFVILFFVTRSTAKETKFHQEKVKVENEIKKRTC